MTAIERTQLELERKLDKIMESVVQVLGNQRHELDNVSNRPSPRQPLQSSPTTSNAPAPNTTAADVEKSQENPEDISNQARHFSIIHWYAVFGIIYGGYIALINVVMFVVTICLQSYINKCAHGRENG